MDRLQHRVRCRRQEAIDEMRPGYRLRLGATVALELRPDASERRQQSVVVEGDVRAIGRAARRRTEIDIAGCQAARELDLKPWEAAVDRLNVGGGSNGAIIRPRPFIPALASQGQRLCHSLVGLEIRKRGPPAIRFSDSGNIN